MRKRMLKKFKRLAALMIAAALIVPVVPINAIAADTPVEDSDSSSDPADFSPMYELAEKYGFKFGTMMNYTKVTTNDDYKELVSRHFNSITPSNEMKAYNMLSQTLSKSSSDGMPRMNFSSADAIMDYAVANGIQVRGHVLVWDAGMSDWFFREDYDTSKPYVSAEVLEARLQYYIKAVITHFEEKYPGVIYAWDVVNEAVGDADTEYDVNDSRHVRTKRSGADNLFYTILGEDYVELSFKYAKDVANEIKETDSSFDLKLFYNDYNTFQDNKRDAIYNLVDSINSFDNGRQLCDGVGMQSYIGGYGVQEGCMNETDVTRVKNAIQKFASLGVEVHITEMALRNYQNDEKSMAIHAEFYEKMFDMLTDINTEDANPLTSVSIWGISDDPSLPATDYSYKMNGPYCGLFDEDLNVKEDFIKVHALMKTKIADSSTEVDKTVLEEAITKAEGKLKADYTVGSWTNLQGALTKAKSAVTNADATQAEVDRLVIILNYALESLVVRGLYYDEIITNGDINGNINNWTAHGGTTLGMGNSTTNSAPNSLKVSGGSTEGSGVKQDITDRVKAGETYTLKAFVYYKTGSSDNANAPANATFNLSILYGAGENKEIMLSQEVTQNQWGEFSGSYTIPEGADTDKVSILIESPAITGSEDLTVFYVDDISMKLDFKTTLKELINEAENKEQSIYTNESWSDLQEVLEGAREVVANEDATQEDVDQISAVLEEAIKSLLVSG